MLFSSLTDPVELARAQSALDAAWAKLSSQIYEDDWVRERARLSHIVVSFVGTALDEDDLLGRVLERYRKQP